MQLALTVAVGAVTVFAKFLDDPGKPKVNDLQSASITSFKQAGLNQRWPTRKCVYLVKLVYPVFCSCDLDLDPMTLIYEYDLGILKM